MKTQALVLLTGPVNVAAAARARANGLGTRSNYHPVATAS